MIPDLEYYKSHFDLSDPLYFGYYFHLYLDYYYLEDYLENNQKGIDVFAGPTLYHDYDIYDKAPYYKEARKLAMEKAYQKASDLAEFGSVKL